MESIRKVFLKPDPKQEIIEKIHRFIKDMTEQQLITFYHARHLRKFLNVKRNIHDPTPEDQLTYEKAAEETQKMVQQLFQLVDQGDSNASLIVLTEIMQTQCFQASTVSKSTTEKKHQKSFQSEGGDQGSKQYRQRHKGGQKREYTHFISLPLQTQEVKQLYGQWKEEVEAMKYPEIPRRLFVGPDTIHITLLMLPLGEPGQVEKAIAAMKSVEEKIITTILSKGQNGTLALPLLPGLQYFGKPDSVRVMFLEPDTGHNQIELLRTVIGIMIQAMLDHKVLEEHELSHIRLNEELGRHENDQLHITLMNSTFAKVSNFDGRPIIFNHSERLPLKQIIPSTIEISTRGSYDERKFYKPIHIINLN